MNTPRRITANFLSLVASEFMSKLIQLLIFAYLARSFGKEEFGIFSFGLAFGLLAAIVTDFGLSVLLVREISRNRKDVSKYLSNSFIVKIVLVFITIILSYGILNAMGYSEQIKLIAYIMLSFAILQTFTDFYSSIFKAYERMQYDAIIKTSRMVMLSAIIFYAVKKNFSLAEISFLFPITEAIVLLMAIALVYTKFARISLGFDLALAKKLVKESSLFCLSIAFAGLFLYIDLIMLTKLDSISNAGIYAAASNLVVALISIPMMYGNAIYPVISRLYVSSRESLKFAYERSFKYMLIAGIAISAGVYSLSSGIVKLLYGMEYGASSIVLAILAWYLALRFVNVISGFTLSSINKQKARVLSQGINVASKITFNLILIPVYGIVGAAVATVIAEVIFFALYNFFVLRYGLKIGIFRQFIKPVTAAIIMILAIQFIGNIFVAAISGAAIYFSVLLILRAIDEKDKKLFIKVIRNI